MLQIYLLLCKATSYQYKKALQNQNASHYVFIQSTLAGFFCQAIFILSAYGDATVF